MNEELKHKMIIRGEHWCDCKIGKEVTVVSHSYYILDLNSCDVISYLPHSYPVQGFLGRTVAVGSRIFILGNRLLGDKDDNEDDDEDYEPKIRKRECYVYSLDLTKLEQGWRRAPSPLIKADSQPVCVHFGGKIYVFRDTAYGCRCEVYDPQTNQWLRIKSPPARRKSKIYISPPPLIDYENDRIFIRYFNTKISLLYAYYPNDDKWVLVNDGFTGWPVDYEEMTIGNGVIYVFDYQHRNSMRAFDIATKQWFKVTVPDDYESYVRISKESFIYRSLVHRGNGLLCLLGSTTKGPPKLNQPTTIVRAVEFRVKFNHADKEAYFTWVSSRDINLNDHSRLFQFLLV